LRAHCAYARGVEAVVIGEQDFERLDAAKDTGDGRRFIRGVRGTDARGRERRGEGPGRATLQSSISAW
jgi:hypothetical protein